MIKAIWSIAMLDLLLWRRMPIAIASALIPPLTMAALLFVLSLAVTQQPVALVVEGKGPNAERMAKIIQADDDAYLLSEADAASALKMLENQEVAAVITVPKDFDEKIAANQIAKVQLKLNNVDIDFADDIRRSVDRSVAQFDTNALSLEGAHEAGAESESKNAPKGLRDIKGETAEDEAKEEAEIKLLRATGNGNPYLIGIEEHDLRQTNVDWLNYQIIPVLVLLVLSVGLVGTSLLCAQDIERKTARYLVLTPQRSWVLLAGRLLGGFLASMIVLIPAISICALLGIINPPLNHWPALAAIFAATALFASGLGAIIGAVLTGARTIALASCVTATYLFFLGGGFTTIAFLPEWLRLLSTFAPTRYAIDGMRQALFYSTLDGINTDLLVLLATALAACAIGSLSVRRAWLN